MIAVQPHELMFAMAFVPDAIFVLFFTLFIDDRALQNVFITGGCASFPNFSERLHKELEEMRPFESSFSLSMASDVVLDSWKGARRWAASSEMLDRSVTVAEYNEKGRDYLKEHFASNIFTSSVLPVDQS
jgi:actin-related protein 5